MKRLLLIGLFAALLGQGFKTRAAEADLAVFRLIERIAPGHGRDFVVETIPAASGENVFVVEARAGKIVLRGDSALSQSIAFNWRCWEAGARVINTNLFVPSNGPGHPFLYKATGRPASLTRVILNSDQPFYEVNVRYFMADIALGGSLEFYRGAAESAHELSCLEAVRRTEDGYQITNLDQFERERTGGNTLITHKGTNARIHGMDVKLSSD